MSDKTAGKWTVYEFEVKGLLHAMRALYCGEVQALLSVLVDEKDHALYDLIPQMCDDLNAAEARRSTEPGSASEPPKCGCLCHPGGTHCPYCEEGRHIPAHSEVEGVRIIPVSDGYAVDDAGSVYSRDGKQLHPYASQRGSVRYYTVTIFAGGVRKSRTVHSLVAEAFHGPRPSPAHQVRHLNGDSLDNRPENLAWGTNRDNTADRIRHGRRMWGRNTGSAKLTDDDVRIVRRLLAEGESHAAIGRRFGVWRSTIRKIAIGVGWVHVQ